MFTKPNAGWSKFDYGGVQANASYLIDIPQEWLITLLAHYKLPIPGRTFVLEIDEEGRDTYIIWNGNCMFAFQGNNSIVMDCDVEDFVFDFCHDIESNIDDWVNFIPCGLTEDEFKSRKKSILSKVKRLLKSAKSKNILTERVF